MTFQTPSIILILTVAINLFGSLSNAEEPREGGLTGTGLIGVLNVAQEIDVAGQNLTFPQDLVVRSPLGPLRATELSSGDIVAVGLATRDTGVQVEDARQLFAIIGPVATVSDNNLSIMGTSINVAELPQLDLTSGDWVAVSGFWRKDEVFATGLKAIPPQAEAQIFGTLANKTADRIGGTSISSVGTQTYLQFDAVQVFGQPVGEQLVATRIVSGLFDRPVRRILAQGFLSSPNDLGDYTVLGTGFRARTDRPEMIDSHQLQLHCSENGALLAKEAIGLTVDQAVSLQNCLHRNPHN
ncbi:hypothetical protein [uncultured Roseobacter sp.]|uniref:hypothetical protein n=1 Tax=uncultured Roseobacter sp. TaxID=114847 RepID=UPI0026060C76|nr:hypothetical protein [uncultured Roseobacter sp.]